MPPLRPRQVALRRQCLAPEQEPSRRQTLTYLRTMCGTNQTVPGLGLQEVLHRRGRDDESNGLCTSMAAVSHCPATAAMHTLTKSPTASLAPTMPVSDVSRPHDSALPPAPWNAWRRLMP